MGSTWRSAPMHLVQLFVQMEAAHDTVDELGQLGVIQFRDLNPNVNAFHRNFINEVRRMDEMERKVRFFEEQVMKEKGLAKIVNSVSLEHAGTSSGTINVDDLEGRFDELEKELLSLNSNQQMLDRSQNELVELKHVLSADSVFFAREHDSMNSPLLADAPDPTSKGIKLGYITGVISRTKLTSFERVLWRTTRGNLFMRQTDIPESIKDPQTGELVEKNVFIVFFQGDRLQVKVRKICESFGATLYPCPDSEEERADVANQINVRLQDLQVVLARSHEHRVQILSAVARTLQTWKAKILKEKAIYHTMNFFNYDVGRKCLIAEGWCPQAATEEVSIALRRATTRAGALVPSVLSVIHTHEIPPTHFETNKFTHAYQEIVNAYGMAHYGEVNPAVITLVTFPFLFGVMFGDVGHGIFLFIFSLLLILKEDALNASKLNEIVQMPFDGRYVLIVMSCYAIFCGFIYNEFFSIPLDIFGTAWEEPQFNLANNETFNWTDPTNANAMYTPIHGKVYPFGVDPMWKGSPNELDYYNSFKMKVSILLGIIQMSLGIFISCFNYAADKPPLRWINICFQFIPQIIFLWAIFGYMCVLIIIKWCTDWTTYSNPPPAILPIIINMFLSPGQDPPEPQFFANQHLTQIVLTITAIICVPIMLLFKPFLLRHYHNKHASHRRLDDGDGDEEEPINLGHHGQEFEFSEIMIHQIIHTIEFILGAISNTASYLRLWALSLAHSELSTVFWNRILLKQIQSESFLRGFVGYAVWVGGTVSVLLVMETLSAFLHALRLHWVEFQNKFYIGDGIRFLPFSYKKILSGTQDEE